MTPIPDKQFFRINEVCQVTDTQPYVLRFWESEFPQLAPDRKGGGQSLYRRQDVALVMRIKQLLYDEEYTLDRARACIEEELSSRGGKKGKGKTVAGKKATPRAGKGSKTKQPVSQTSPTVVPAASRGNDRLDFGGEAGVARERYEDAIEEIAHLRLLVQEADAKLRKADGLRQASDRRAAHHQARSEKLFARFEQLLQILEKG
ncbi:MAG: MerR family transcriptional regulator [Acidobacteriota bacterium]|nr:MerR family transcriptional regulator [Acidobacteriota bacterium]MDH3786389.1 MerR family transcriptional regulator [Acidobacteriota bacterium]